jgi:hypothetical protein
MGVQRWRQSSIHWVHALILAIFLPPVLGGEEIGVSARAKLAAEHLVRSQLANGFFVYEHDFLSGMDSSKDNVVRQAGTAYSLAEYHSLFPDSSIKQAIGKALKGFEAASVEWQGGWLLTFDASLKKAKAGATALALLAALIASDDPIDQAFSQIKQGWVKGLLGLQMSDGGFASRPGSDQQSPYSNGEIWLAFALYHRAFPDEEGVLQALQRADRFMISNYADPPDIGFFHWGVMAAAARHETSQERRFADFIALQMKSFLHDLRPTVKYRANSCYSVEGLLEGAAVLRGYPEYRGLFQQAVARVEKEMQKNRQLQILPGQKSLRFSEQRFLSAPEIPSYAGAFLNGRYRPQVRIDATQHCLSAMIKELRYGVD